MLNYVFQRKALPGDQYSDESGQGIVKRQVTHLEGKTWQGVT